MAEDHRMRIAVTGASGLIGTTLVPALRDAGHEVLRLVRHDAARADEIAWDPARRRLEPQALAGVDAVIHLAGVGVGDHRWTNAYKAQILSSRVDGTLTLARAIANAQPRARVLLSASGIDYYAKAAAAAVDEGAPAGSGFLAQTCVAWERATAPAEEAGVRVVHLRTGIVLARNGGSLGRMLPLFRLGLGGRRCSPCPPPPCGWRLVAWLTKACWPDSGCDRRCWRRLASPSRTRTSTPRWERCSERRARRPQRLAVTRCAGECSVPAHHAGAGARPGRWTDKSKAGADRRLRAGRIHR